MKKLAHSRLYLLIDRTDKERRAISASEEEATPEFLSEKNQDGYNVYITVNSFYSGRRLEANIAECRYIFVDVDLPREEIPTNEIEYQKYKTEHRDILLSRVQAIKEDFGISPEEINETYKGFHLLYPVDKEVSKMSKDTYFQISTLLTEHLDGDASCRDLARVYKVPGFLDRKEGRNFEVTRIISDKALSIPVTKDILKALDINYVEQESKPCAPDSVVEKSQRSFEIAMVPFSEILEILKSDGREFEFDSLGKLAGSDGIIWNKEEDYINDFSHGKTSGDNRANGNWNFLKNIAYPGDYEGLSIFLSKFGIRASTKKNGIPMLVSLLMGISSGSYKASMSGVDDEVISAYEKEVGSVNSVISEGIDAGEYYRVLIAVFAGISEGKYKESKYEDGRIAYAVDINSLMESLNMKSTQTSSRKAIIKTLATAQFLRKNVVRKVMTPEGKTIDATGSVPLMDVFLAKNGRHYNAYIAFNTKVKKDGAEDRLHYMNRDILGLEKGRGTGKKTAFAIEVDMWVKSKGVAYNCSLTKAAEKLGLTYSNKSEIRRAVKVFLDSLKSLGVVQDYSFNSNL